MPRLKSLWLFGLSANFPLICRSWEIDNTADRVIHAINDWTKVNGLENCVIMTNEDLQGGTDVIYQINNESRNYPFFRFQGSLNQSRRKDTK